MATHNGAVNTVENLPTELLVKTMSYLRPKEVLNLMLTSKRFRDVARDHEVVLANALLHNHCNPDAIQMALAHHAAAVAEWKPRKNSPGPGPAPQEVRKFCHLYLAPNKKEASLPKEDRNLQSVGFICAFHDASLYLAWDCLVSRCMMVGAADSPPLTPAAVHKYVYVIAIIGHILHTPPTRFGRGTMQTDVAWDIFSQCLTTREKGEVLCMVIFLSRCINKDFFSGAYSTRRKEHMHFVSSRPKSEDIALPGLRYILAYGLEHFIMPTSSYRPRRNLPVDKCRPSNPHLRSYLWREFEYRTVGATLERRLRGVPTARALQLMEVWREQVKVRRDVMCTSFTRRFFEDYDSDGRHYVLTRLGKDYERSRRARALAAGGVRRFHRGLFG